MKKLQCLGYSLLPVIMWLSVQVVVTVGFSVVVGIVYGFLLGTGNAEFFAEYMKKEYLSIISVMADAVFLIPGYFWLRNLQQQETLKKNNSAVFNWKAWIRIFFFGILIQFAVGMFLMILQMLAPEAMETHHKALENLGMYTPTVWSVLYTVVLAPIMEEVFCRGLILKILEKAFPFWAANMLQALYFGLIHGNLVQGMYAFLIGILFGISVRKYGTLKAAMFFHFVINLSGMLIGNFSPNISQRVLIIMLSAVMMFLFREKRRNG